MLYLRSPNRIFSIRLLLIASVMASATAQASTATLDVLVAGGNLTEGNAIFDSFFFEDDSDTEVDASSITLSTSSTASTVRLTTVIEPELELLGESEFPNEYFYFLMDFKISIDGGLLQLSSVDLGFGDLHATGLSYAETLVWYALGDFEVGNDATIEIIESTETGSQTADSHTLGSLATEMDFAGEIVGDIGPGSDPTAGLSTFSFTFNLVEPPPPVPVPAAVWLFGTALIGLVGFCKRRKAT